MIHIRYILSGLTLLCLALGCGGNSTEDTSNSNQTGGYNSSATAGTSGNGGNVAFGQDSGLFNFEDLQREPEPLTCGDTPCTQLEPTDGGVESLLSLGLQYCCTPTNQCSLQLIGATECPDKVSCGGVECQSVATDIGTLVGTGTVCCSPSGKCSVMPPGATECPEPDIVDPECPSVVDTFGNIGAAFQDGGFGGQGCCLPDNTCGVIFMGTCTGNALAEAFPQFFNAPVYDCDGNLVEPVVQDAGTTGAIDSGTTPSTGSDAATDAEDSGA